MRSAVDELQLLASRVVLPAEGETVELPGGPGRTTAEVPAFAEDPRTAPGVPPRLGRRVDRFAALAYQSVRELVATLDMPDPERVGVFFANTRAGWSYAEPQLHALIRKGPSSVHPYFVTAWFPTAATGEVTIGLGYRGASKTTTGRLSGFAEALWLARDALERRAVDMAIVGAVDSVVTPFAMLDWPEGPHLPSSGPAEGAVVFAVRSPTTAGDSPAGVLLRLRYEQDCRSEPADRHWIPTLSFAAGLAKLTAQPAELCSTVDVALGGGYVATVRNASNDPAGRPHR